MDLYYITLFLAIAEQESISGAARVLHFAQPTVSEQLTRLEKELGVQLVAREKGSRRVILTPAGKAFLTLAQRYRDMQKKLDDDIAQFVLTQSSQVFRLVSGGYDQANLVPIIMQKLARRAPGVRLHLQGMDQAHIPQAMAAASFHAALVHGSPDEVPPSPFYETRPLCYERVCALCPADTPLPDRLLTPEDLDPAYEVLVSNRSTSKWHDKYFSQDTIPYCTSSSQSAAHSYLLDRRCWCLLPASIAHKSMTEHPGTLVLRQVEPAPEPRYYSLLISKALAGEEVMQTFLRCCEEMLDEQPYLQRLLPE